ncbi:universal stress protein [Halostella sp. JP-L12]|uniref:universal stress protein n=1 Tax=Halostella TaxID=1843185 RepID=UPI000EF7F9BB|nr:MULTISPECIES: universal stress protein [Halostella]NHN48343.1 universal stress protein [Halostella sp. JP-L12]
MRRALVVVDGQESTKELVREAGELAAGVDAELLLLHVTSEEEFADRQESLAQISGFDATYGIGQAEEGATQFAREIGREALPEGVDFEAIGRIGDEVSVILSTAAERECDHVFVQGRQRSPTGKALFGDRAQRVALEFDGPVTVLTA